MNPGLMRKIEEEWNFQENVKEGERSFFTKWIVGRMPPPWSKIIE